MVDPANFNTDRSAFTVREPKLKPMYIILIGLLSAIVILFSMQYDNPMLTAAVVILTSASLVGLLYLNQSTNFDERTATEFQALIFSGAMRSNTLLTLIIHRDGSIFYLDPRYNANFAKSSQNHNLDQFLSNIGLESADKIRVYDSIRDLSKSEFEYVSTIGSKPMGLIIGIYPIQRPDGFVALCLMER